MSNKSDRPKKRRLPKCAIPSLKASEAADKPLLQEHFEAYETFMTALSGVPENAGHSIHLGTPREWFVRQFLSDHLSEAVAIGSGEIVDCDSKAGDFSQDKAKEERRNQSDIVIYERTSPRIYFGGGIHGFLAESVIATIEVKSNLTCDELRKSIKSARNIKRLKAGDRSATPLRDQGYRPPAILNFVVAYGGPAKMETVLTWLRDTYDELKIDRNPLPIGMSRWVTPSPAIDGIFVLGRGLILFDNWRLMFAPEGFNDEFVGKNWLVCSGKTGTLFYLFLCISQAVHGTYSGSMRMKSYAGGFHLEQVKLEM